RSHSCRNTALVQLDLDGFIYLNYFRRPDHFPIRCETNRVTALQYRQRAQCIQRMRDSRKSLMPLLQPLLHRGGQTLFANLHTMSTRINESHGSAELFQSEQEVVTR